MLLNVQSLLPLREPIHCETEGVGVLSGLIWSFKPDGWLYNYNLPVAINNIQINV